MPCLTIEPHGIAYAPPARAARRAAIGSGSARVAISPCS